MSEFYKKTRDLIINNYKYLGMKEKVSFYVYRGLMILIIFEMLLYLCQLDNLENSKSIGLGILISVGIALLLYFFSKRESEKQQEDKIEAVSKFIKEPDINLAIVDALVEEIKRYNKKMRTFATWIAGLSATFIILLVTFLTNFFMRVFDVLLNAVPGNELLNMIKNINQSEYIDNDAVSSYLTLGIILLILFIAVILIIYNAFVMCIFVKEQILIFLFDARYKLLFDDSQESKSEDEEASSVHI